MFVHIIVETSLLNVLLLTTLQNKCTRYWPELEQSSVYGKVHVFTTKEISNQIYILRELLIHNEDNDGEGRDIFHFHFKAWPDHGTPQDPGKSHSSSIVTVCLLFVHMQELCWVIWMMLTSSKAVVERVQVPW